MNRELIKEVMSVAKRLDEKNLVNTFEGNISAREGGRPMSAPMVTANTVMDAIRVPPASGMMEVKIPPMTAKNKRGTP